MTRVSPLKSRRCRTVALPFVGLVFLALLLLSLLPFPFAHAEEKPEVLRVGFAQLPGFTETDENGELHGLVVDYLNEIAKYQKQSN